ncbi:SDR family NAD(P)-dependent oxidoreductase [Nocardioides nematodiphilus]|uniref:SDR family NAD(P)-dependent oxidoreductase n=1 Tax=Nocardioides nematodiphilus TaxID=2849669 RepID=UPI001CD92DEE|nr:SDR family NAD(P)-dependent oxidoreductase [Nocardioides nematodiphilus]MCA1982698.1 SDR family NAD(P)-dependent oxidoreductase [Nocardioides nematodiphilus]
MTITFITGANKGLGHETARRLIEAGHSVILGARDAERGAKAAAALGARFVQIDVTDDDSVAAAAKDVAANEGAIDVLINNAGITGRQVAGLDELTGPDAVEVFDTNAISIVRVTHAFLPLLRQGTDPRVVNVTSGLGSQTLTHDPARVESHVISPLYNGSKAAVTMMTMQYAKGIADVRFNAVDPGYTATDLNGNTGTQSVTEGTDAIVGLATEPAEAGTGRVVNRHGVVPW